MSFAVNFASFRLNIVQVSSFIVEVLSRQLSFVSQDCVAHRMSDWYKETKGALSENTRESESVSIFFR